MALMLPTSRIFQPTRNSNLTVNHWTQGSFFMQCIKLLKPNTQEQISQIIADLIIVVEWIFMLRLL